MTGRDKVAHINYTKKKMRIKSTYDSAFVVALKEATTSRRWDPRNKEWAIDTDEYKNALEVVHQFYDTVREENKPPAEMKPKVKTKSSFVGKSSITKKHPSMNLETWIDGACEPINPGGTATYGVVLKNNMILSLEKLG